MNYVTVKEMALKWGISERRVTLLCQQNRINGVIKEGKVWKIPMNAKKPIDRRIASGEYMKPISEHTLPLPIGISDYPRVVSNYYYVDKTLMIKEMIDDGFMISLFTRPRRFGKTLNMNMIKTFFEINQEDTSCYFQHQKIWSCGPKYRNLQGNFPVIYLSFKDLKHPTWSQSYQSLCLLFALEADRHHELETSTQLTPFEKELYHKFVHREANESEYQNFLFILSKLLMKHYGKQVMIMMDEYDTIIEQGYMNHYYDEVIHFMRNFLSHGLKDNPYLIHCVMTGILKISKESIFSGLNNIGIYSVFDQKYSTYFGFTKEEVKTMCEYYGDDNTFDELCEWYDGYRFKDSEIFNPWSVINYFHYGNEARPYWTYTGSNEVMKQLLDEANKDVYDQLQKLLFGHSIISSVDVNVIYPLIPSESSIIFGFLLLTGYLTIKKRIPSYYDDLYELVIPNKEIKSVYQKEILSYMNQIFPTIRIHSIYEAIYRQDEPLLKVSLERLLKHSISYFDSASESFYHGFMLGLCSIMSGYYTTSNQEAGNGRYDILLRPIQDNLPGIIIEIKACKNKDKIQLKQISMDAIQQIKDKEYDLVLKREGIHPIYYYGIAFCKKDVEITIE